MYNLFYLFIFTQGFTIQVHSSQNHGAVHQYVHVSGCKGHPIPYTAIVSPSYKEPHLKHTIQASPFAYPGIPHPVPVIEEAKPPELPGGKTEKDVKNTFDTNLLNNLAIALQLLIVSNILNMPQDGALPILPELLTKPSLPAFIGKPEPLIITGKSEAIMNGKADLPIMIYPRTYPESVTKEDYPFTIIYKPYDQGPIVVSPYESPYIGYCDAKSEPQPYYLSPMPSYDPIVAPPTTATTARKTMTLMSPYEALGRTLEPVEAAKRELQSPYASILANSDLFSVSDLF